MSACCRILAAIWLFAALVPLIRSVARASDENAADYGQRITSIAGDADVWWCEAGWKVDRQRPAPLAAAPEALMSAAKNDSEAVQIIVRPKNDLQGFKAALGGLHGPDGASIPAENVQVLRVHYHAVPTPSDSAGTAGLWPDALPPLDSPLELKAGENRPLWVSVHVPDDAKPGDYSGQLRLTAESWSAVVPIRLHVWNFALPKRNQLETAVGLSPEVIFRYHRLATDAQKRQVWRLYMQNLAAHRISPYNPVPLDPIRVEFKPDADPPRAIVDFSAFDPAMTDAIEKYGLTNFGLHIEGMGRSVTDGTDAPHLGDFREGTPQYDAMFSSYVQQLEGHLRDKGWLKMAFTYWFDEPNPSDYPFVRAGMERLKKYAPGLQTSLTKQPEEGLPGAIDIWCPLSWCYDHEAAQRRRAVGERFWWYVCCQPKAPFCTLFLDHAGPELRVWLWQTWQRNIEGILTWEATYWTSRPDLLQNPYDDPMSYNYGTTPEQKQSFGNGDGRFLYPPLASVSPDGGSEPILEPPVSSIRWETLREGIEDYELLWLLRDRIERRRSDLPQDMLAAYQSLLQVPEDITRDATTFTSDVRLILKRRSALAEAIEELAK